MKNVLIKVPLLRGGAVDGVMAGVGLSAAGKNTPLHPSQEGNRTGLAFIHALFLLVLSFCFSIKSSAQVINVDAKLHEYTIKIGDQTKLFLSSHQPVKQKVAFPKLVDTVVGRVQIVSTSKLDTVFDPADHNQATITQTYVITCFDAGTYKIPHFTFGTAGGPLTTNEMSLQVETVKVDTTKAIYDIKQPMTVSYTFWDWLKDNWLYVLICLAIVGAIVGIVWYIKNKPKKVDEVKVVMPIIPLHIIALNKLQELKDKKLWQKDLVKEYHSELTDVLREYLEKRYAIKTYEKTTDEIFDSLKYLEIKDGDRNSLRKILVLADLVKFAKEKPAPAENEDSMDSAVNFVTATQPVVVPLPPKAKEEEGTSGAV